MQTSDRLECARLRRVKEESHKRAPPIASALPKAQYAKRRQLRNDRGPFVAAEGQGAKSRKEGIAVANEPREAREGHVHGAEQMPTAAGKPRARDQAAYPQRFPVCGEMVDNSINEFERYSTRPRGHAGRTRPRTPAQVDLHGVARDGRRLHNDRGYPSP
jgi:hypothetical protein